MNNLQITEQLKEEIGLWIRALRSGKFKQAQGRLQTENGYCCLGVACKILIPDETLKKGIIGVGLMIGGMPGAQPNAPEWLNDIDTDFISRTGISLTYLNDKKYYNGTYFESLSFDEIADMLQLVYLEGAL